MKLCAGRIWQLLNEASLANECGVSTPTINSLLSVLEASFILYRLRPDFRNFNKRVVKTPKLYFYDTDLACSLLEIDSPSQLKSHFARGSLFENLVINEFMKSSLNQGKEPRLSFWSDNVGHEVDLIQDRGGKPYAYEIKSAETFNWEFLDGHLADAPFLAIARQVVFLAVLVYPPADRIWPYSEFLGYLICGLFAFQDQFDDLFPCLGVVVDFCHCFTFLGLRNEYSSLCYPLIKLLHGPVLRGAFLSSVALNLLLSISQRKNYLFANLLIHICWVVSEPQK